MNKRFIERKKDVYKAVTGFILILMPSTLVLSGDIAWTIIGLVYSLALQQAICTRKGKKYIKKVMESINRI